ncbi:type IV toxin-antitoxin system AbiEi family antitoxin domain-containing protein [Georgenia daeguensis]|uniref:type IV toxin-antitoxin system AbiEi family antitoxin domain-containing protein n=1 Tax=Georgenia daeguensis TaxID=908355 RepID=UPI0031E774EA
MRARVDLSRVDRLTRQQDSVITRAQLLACGATADWISRQVTGRRWQRLHPGIYLVHTGQPTWLSRARAALLYAGRGAVLSHDSAAYRHGLTDRRPPIVEVLVPHGRKVRRRPGVRIRSRRSMPDAWGRLPAVGPIDTILDLVDRPRTAVDEVVALLCRAARKNLDGEAILRAAQGRCRLRHRALLVEMLGRVADGVESPLELRYDRVERSHGLPPSRLQAREVLDGLRLRADRRYAGYQVRVELDGQLAHPFGRTDKDVWRDNVVGIVARELTLRYRWNHLAVTPCHVARQVALALRTRGWTGVPRPCRPGCPVVEVVNLPVRGGDPSGRP